MLAPSTEVLPGVLRLGSSRVNWYAVVDGEGVTVVDAGIPGYWPQLEPALAAAGRRLEDVKAVVLTHAHSDHTGVSGLLHERGAPVYLNAADEGLIRTGKESWKREASPLPNLWRPGVWSFFIHMMRNGALKSPKIEDTRQIADGEEVDVPGRPRVVHAPGHTPGHCAIYFEQHRALFTGDLLCTWNPLTGKRGPQIMPRAFNVSSVENLASLEKIKGLEARALLPGHGEPWTDGVARAVERAHEAGTS